MSHEYWLWVGLSAYALHVIEELMLDWKDWANNTLKLPVDWSNFYITNSAVIVLGVAAASIGWKNPSLSLSFPALMLINAIFFHILPFIVKKKFSPGFFTAVLLFLPLASWIYYGAKLDGVLNAEVFSVSLLIGVALMAYPIVLLKLKDKAFFKQT